MTDTVKLIAATLGVIVYLILFALAMNDTDFPAQEQNHERGEQNDKEK